MWEPEWPDAYRHDGCGRFGLRLPRHWSFNVPVAGYAVTIRRSTR